MELYDLSNIMLIAVSRCFVDKAYPIMFRLQDEILDSVNLNSFWQMTFY